MPKRLTQTVTIKRSESEPEALDLIADAILRIAEGLDRINNSRLHKDIAVLLVAKASGVNIKEVRKVLAAAPQLRRFVR